MVIRRLGALAALFIAASIQTAAAQSNPSVQKCGSFWCTTLGVINGSTLTALPGDATNGLWVNIKSGGGSGGTASSFGAAFPATGTAVGMTDGTNMQPFKGDTTNGVWSNIKANAIEGVLGTAAGCAAGSNNTIISCLYQLHLDVTGAIPSGSNSIGNVGVNAGTNYMGQVGLNAVTSGGWTPTHFIAANSNNATNLKNAGGIVHAIEVYGIGTTPAYLKFYDKASSPTCQSDTVVKSIMIPAASTAANGAGANVSILDTQFSTGISYCVVTGLADNDNTSVAAATFNINIDWK